VSVRQLLRVARHEIPGAQGDQLQLLGRPAARVELSGVLFGDDAGEALTRLRDLHARQEPVDFFAEITGEGFLTRVLVVSLDVFERSGHVDEYDFSCVLMEYTEPPAAPTEDPLSGLESDLAAQAAAAVDEAQRGLTACSRLTDLLTRTPSLADPTQQLRDLTKPYTEATKDLPATLNSLRSLL
jgi:phage protein U